MRNDWRFSDHLYVMQLGTDREFALESNSITVTLLLRRDAHERWTLFLRTRRWRKAVHLRILMENHTLAVLGNGMLNHNRARARYQPVGADYVRQNVKVHWHVWASLQALARGLGVSTCYLVAFLIDADLASSAVGTPSSRIVPAFNTVHRLTVTLDLELTRVYLRHAVQYQRCPRNERLAQMLARIPRV